MRFFYSLYLLKFITACAPFGKNPSDERLSSYKSSPQFDAEKEVFFTIPADLNERFKKRTLNWATIKKWFFQTHIDRVPAEKLPEILPDLEEFKKPTDTARIIWLGHSTILLNLGGKILLIDPIFSCCAAPFPFMVKRFQDPVLQLADLPTIDYIVISHDHYDHLDMKTIKFFVEKKNRFIVPLGVGGHLESWGIAKDRIVESDWWQSTIENDLVFTAAPAQHFSGRGLKRNATLWASWVIYNGKTKIFFSGDGGYGEHFKEIGKRHGPFDLVFMENGQYNESWPEVHILPEMGVQAFFDLKGKLFFPIHWSMFTLSFHPWYEPAERLYREAARREIKILTPKIGKLVDLENVGDRANQEAWWRPYIKG